jgi:hypothetical protein
MNRIEEWDWPPRRHRYRWGRYRPIYRTIEGYQPSGWNSPIAKKVIHIYWRVTINVIKILIAIPLSLLFIGGLWLIWTLMTL